jgi:hypothetical protein
MHCEAVGTCVSFSDMRSQSLTPENDNIAGSTEVPVQGTTTVMGSTQPSFFRTSWSWIRGFLRMVGHSHPGEL